MVGNENEEAQARNTPCLLLLPLLVTSLICIHALELGNGMLEYSIYWRAKAFGPDE